MSTDIQAKVYSGSTKITKRQMLPNISKRNREIDEPRGFQHQFPENVLMLVALLYHPPCFPFHTPSSLLFLNHFSLDHG